MTRRKVVKSVERHIKSLLGKRFRDAVAEDKTKATIKTSKHELARVTGGRGTLVATHGWFERPTAIISWPTKTASRVLLTGPGDSKLSVRHWPFFVAT